jgi:NADH:ubiquinone oxidoreductase subunit C
MQIVFRQRHLEHDVAVAVDGNQVIENGKIRGVWVKREQLLEVGDFLKKLPKPYVMLFDLHGMDEP